MGGEGPDRQLFGALIFGAHNGLVLLNVPSFNEIVTAFVVVIAVAIDHGSNRWPGLRRASGTSSSRGPLGAARATSRVTD
jgi:ribose/xylose/arabinose/galactoside ABC-type transport system permease subunit